MIQAATLIHDDFIDQDVERNGRAATWTVEGPRRAVLIGDMVFAVAIAMMSEIGAEDGRAAARAIARIAKGALHEPLDALSLASMMESDGPAEGIYEEIIRLKTGILFGTACAFGALAAGADRASAAASRRYGLLIGEAYQIADDLEEVRSYLSSSCLDAPRMVSLAPALLRFAPALAPVVLSVLKDERPDLGGLRMP
jgi:geranylgeranyl pyrophosphate synthase